MTVQEEIKLAKIYNEYFRVKYENSKWENIGRVLEYNVDNNEISLVCKNANVSIIFLNDSIVQVKTDIKDKAVIPSFAVTEFKYVKINVDLIENEFFIRIKTKAIILEIIKDPVRIIFKDIKGEIINSDSNKGILFNKEYIKCEKELNSDEVFYGFGEKTGKFQKRGSKMYMWNTDYPYLDSKADPLYKSIPFFIGMTNSKAYGIFMDSPSWSTFDMGNSDASKYSYGTFGLNMNYYFIYGPEIKSVVERYTDLTGKIDLPPLWSIGYQQCRWSYYPEDRVKEIANNFRAKKIPCDVIYLDIDYMDEFKVYTYDKEKIPDMKKMTDYLRQKGFRLVCIIDPGVKAKEGYDIYDEGLEKEYFIKKPSGKVFYADVWPGVSAFPDFLNSKVSRWWASLQKRLLDEGVSGIWNDMNEPATFNTSGKTMSLDALHDYDGVKVDHVFVHNVYGMLENKATKAGMKSANPDERPFVLSRSTYAGGQKYSAVWMGDNTSNEEHLKLSIPQCLNIGMSGFAFSGMDIGGFHENPSPELYTRWLQMGAFFPLCRTHSVQGSNDQEPWSYGGGYEEINRKSIELRYKLLPYIYTLFYTACIKGLPIIRPLVMEYQNDKNVYECDNEFLLGENILIAPILETGSVKRNIYLPEGLWYEYFSNEKFTGCAFYEIDAEIEKIPIFVKAGSIIPEQKVLQYVNEKPVDKIILNVYPGEKLENYLYEDDGISNEYLNGKYRITKFSQIDQPEKMFINISKPEGDLDVMRTIQVNVKGIGKSFASVQYLLNEIVITKSEDEFYKNLDIAYFDESKKIFKIKFNDKSEDVMLTLIY